MRKILCFAVMCVYGMTYSQSEPLNQLDSDGKKHGTWIVWLDKDWKLAKDSMSAVYFRYNYFDHGHSVYAMGSWGGKGNKLEVNTEIDSKKGNANMLDGIYKWYNSKGQLRSEHILKNGNYVSFREYYSDGQIQSYFDYTKHCDTQEHSWYIYTYNKKGEKTSQVCVSADKNGKWLPSRGIDN